MVSSEEFAQLLMKDDKKSTLKIATVIDLFETKTAKIKFLGEDTPSEKEYSYLASYNPVIDDTILLIPILDTYIIVGKILYKERIEDKSYVTSEELSNTLSTALQNYASTEELENYALKSDLGKYMQLDENGSFTIGDVGYYNALYSIDIKNIFKHTGSKIGFFGETPSTKKSLSTVTESDSTSMSACLGYLNNIVELLQRYGLC